MIRALFFVGMLLTTPLLQATSDDTVANNIKRVLDSFEFSSGCKPPKAPCIFPTGQTGATGEARLAAFASLYTLSQSEVLEGDPVLFDNVSAITGGISYINGTGEIVIHDSGCYEVIYQVSLRGTGGVTALSLDDTVVPGSIIDSGAGNQVARLAIIMAITALPNGSVLKVINGGDTDFTLNSATDNVTAYVTIKLLCSNCGNDN